MTVNVIATEERALSDNGRLLEDTGNNTSEYSITVNVTVVGEYLPPPEVDFDTVVVEIFDEEGEEDFIEALDESDNPYFMPVIDNLSVDVVTVEEAANIVEDDSGCDEDGDDFNSDCDYEESHGGI